MNRTAFLLSGLFFVVSPLTGQESTPAEEEVRLARSAAPSNIGVSASVYVRGESGYELARTGDNGFSCLVLGSPENPSVVGPVCYDSTASEYILPVELLKARLQAEGLPARVVEQEVEVRFLDGTFRPPPGFAMAYMMSEAQMLGSAGRWKPHVMIYVPYLTNELLGDNPENSDFPFIGFEEGRAHSTLIIPTPTFVPPLRRPS